MNLQLKRLSVAACILLLIGISTGRSAFLEFSHLNLSTVPGYVYGTRMSTGTSTGLRYVHRHAYVYWYRVMYVYLNLDNIDPHAVRPYDY